MATSLSTSLTMYLRHEFTNDLDLSTTSDPMTLDLKDTMTNGTILNQCDQAWHDQRTVTAAAENIDIAGVLANSFNTVLTFAKIKGLFIHNRSTTPGENLTIGAAGANELMIFGAAADTKVIGPDGIFFIWEPSLAGITGGAGADLLKIDPGAATITYDIVILGTSA